MKATFKAQLITEVVRELEEDTPLPEHRSIEAELAGTDLPVVDKIMLRARKLGRQQHLDVQMDRALRHSRLATLALYALFLALGALAANQAFSQVDAEQHRVAGKWLPGGLGGGGREVIRSPGHP